MSGWELHHGDFREVLGQYRGQAAMVVTSPPYAIGSGGPRRDGQRKAGRYDAKSFAGVTDYADFRSVEDFVADQVEALLFMETLLAPGGAIAYNTKPRRVDGILRNSYEMFLDPRVRDVLCVVEEIVWDRGSTHNHAPQMLWGQTERVHILVRPEERRRTRFVNTAALPFRGDVWRIPVDSRLATRVGHSAPFPEALVRALLPGWSERGDLICDPYTGSGTTGIVSLDMGRRFVGAERELHHWQRATDRIGGSLFSALP